ncbi:MAG: hypothetical protein WC943_01565 [Elusimicrobiota bacterium]
MKALLAGFLAAQLLCAQPLHLLAEGAGHPVDGCSLCVGLSHAVSPDAPPEVKEASPVPAFDASAQDDVLPKACRLPWASPRAPPAS